MMSIFAVVLIALFSAFVYWFMAVRRPVCAGKRAGKVREPIDHVLKSPHLSKYELKSLKSPKMKGHLLKFFSRLSFTRFGRQILHRLVVTKSNLDLLGGEYIPDDPTFFPLLPSADKPVRRFESNQATLQDIADTYQPIGDVQFRQYNSLDYHKAYQSGRYTPLDVAENILKFICDSNQGTSPLKAIIETNGATTIKLVTHVD
jgi:hypothetical protein